MAVADGCVPLVTVRTRLVRRALGCGAVLAASVAWPGSAGAVTYGDFVDSPQLQYPEVVPVWVAGSLCTGTMIEQQVVLTAAHCVYGESGPIQVAVGGSTLTSGRLIDVTASWYHPRYDATFLQNDIALLYLKEPAGVSRLASLPPPGAKKPKRFTMAGWGLDQNGLLTGRLSAINLNDHSAAAARAFKGDYNPRTMIGAGRYFAAEALYGGGCKGDSGGPLYQGLSGSTRVVVGVTSWGAEGCVRYRPTIFTWVTYYVSEIAAAIGQVKNRATQTPIPAGKATPVGVGPTSTTTTTTTTTTVRLPASTSTTTSSTTTTVRPSTTTSSTTTTLAATTTSRVVTSLRGSVSHRITSSDGTTTDPTAVELEIQLSTDVSALPTRLCVYVSQSGLGYRWWLLWGSSDWSGDGERLCVRYTGQKNSSGTYSYLPRLMERVGEQRWSVRIEAWDSLGRTVLTSPYEWIS